MEWGGGGKAAETPNATNFITYYFASANSFLKFNNFSWVPGGTEVIGSKWHKHLLKVTDFHWDNKIPPALHSVPSGIGLEPWFLASLHRLLFQPLSNQTPPCAINSDTI